MNNSWISILRAECPHVHSPIIMVLPCWEWVRYRKAQRGQWQRKSHPCLSYRWGMFEKKEHFLCSRRAGTRKKPGESFLWEQRKQLFPLKSRWSLSPAGLWWFSFMSQHILNTFPVGSGIANSCSRSQKYSQSKLEAPGKGRKQTSSFNKEIIKWTGSWYRCSRLSSGQLRHAAQMAALWVFS